MAQFNDKSSRTIFVRNISYNAGVQDLYNIDFFKNATEIKIPIDQQTGRSKGYGFIEFNTTEERDNAINGANGVLIDNRELICTPSQPRSNGQGQAPRQNQAPRVNQYQNNGGFQNQGRQQSRNDPEKCQRTIFVRNLSWNASANELYQLPEFQNAADIKVPTQPDNNDPFVRRSKGIAFIEFETQEECAAALNAVAANPLSIDNRELICAQSQPKENQNQGGYQRQFSGGYQGGHQGQQQQGQWNGQQNYGQQNNGNWN